MEVLVYVSLVDREVHAKNAEMLVYVSIAESNIAVSNVSNVKKIDNDHRYFIE